MNGGEALPFVMFCGCWGFTLLLSLAGLVLTVWMLIDCVVNEPNEGNEKLIWVLILLFTNIVGALIYLFVRRPERIRMYGK